MKSIQNLQSIAYSTSLGLALKGFAEEILCSPSMIKYLGKVQLIFTSPPFPLNRKKKYGNRQGDEYIEWLAAFAPIFKDYLSDEGSIVLEIGNAWIQGEPAMSTLALEALLKFLKTGDFKLCQQFICYNPARLPTPAQWVTINRVRVKDSYTQLWWMSKTTHPKADNRNVLKPYSPAMIKLLSRQKYNSGRRPSEHSIDANSFLKDNKGAIPSNVLTITNTLSKDPYLDYCKKNKLPIHPARMSADLAAFFIKFLSDKKDIVMDPFAGSNITGVAAESLNRRWISIEPNSDYIEGSRSRFSINSEDEA